MAPPAGPSHRPQAPVVSSSANRDRSANNRNPEPSRGQNQGSTRTSPEPLPSPSCPSASANPSQKGKERARDLPAFTRYSITESGRTWGVGQVQSMFYYAIHLHADSLQIGTSRVDTRDREVSSPLPCAVLIQLLSAEGAGSDSDDDHVYNDYDSHPRQAARAEAYGITAPNPHAVPAHEEFDHEDLDEMEADPEANIDEDAERFDEHLPADVFEQNTLQVVEQTTLNPIPQRAAVNTQRQVVLLREERASAYIICSHHSANGIVIAGPDLPDKRQAMPSRRAAEEEEQQHVRRRAQRTTQPARKKPRAADYDPEAKQVLERAITVFKARLTLENVYPDNLQGRTWAKQAWEHAAEDFEVPDLEPDADAITLVRRSGR